jgi:uncharacterized protein
MTPLETVQSIYTAFGRGDVPAILACLADDVAWEAWANNSAVAAGVPWLKELRGAAAVVEFFQVVGQMQIRDFQVLSLMAGGNQVAAEITIDAVSPSGMEFRDEEMHLWTFNDAGKV